MKRILVPFDFSGPAQEAYRFAIDLAARSNGKVFVTHVIDLPVVYESTFGLSPYLFDDSLLKDLENTAISNFEKMFTTLGGSMDNVTFNAIHGKVTPVIQSFIKSRNIDLVVMGTHGTGTATEAIVGSNTEKIVRHSFVPVFSLRKSPDINSIKNIVFATSFDPDEKNVVQRVKDLQFFFGATIHILYVNTPHMFKRDNQIKGAGEAYSKVHQFKNFTLNMRCDYSEEFGIMAFAYETKADLIAMTTHSRTGLSHILRGSIAEEIVNHHIGCPVWTCSLKNIND